MNVDYFGQKWLYCLSVDGFLLCIIMDMIYLVAAYFTQTVKNLVRVISVIITVFRPECSRAINDDTERKTFRVFKEDQRAKHWRTA